MMPFCGMALVLPECSRMLSKSREIGQDEGVHILAHTGQSNCSNEYIYMYELPFALVALFIVFINCLSAGIRC